MWQDRLGLGRDEPGRDEQSDAGEPDRPKRKGAHRLGAVVAGGVECRDEQAEIENDRMFEQAGPAPVVGARDQQLGEQEERQ
jgi:hypothetical protein